MLQNSELEAPFLQRELHALGLREGAVVMVHASLSAFGSVRGGAATVIRAIRDCVGPNGTIVVPTFTPDVRDADPQSRSIDAGGPYVAPEHTALYHPAMPTPMGAIPNAVLADPEHFRGSHPQASVAALGHHARYITADQPLTYALGKHSPFAKMYRLAAHILLLGVGHNRNTFLHYAESMVPAHRIKRRRFPYVIGSERVCVEVPDVGDDNGRFFPLLGSEADAAGLIRKRTIGAAPCQLMESTAIVDFAKARLATLLDNHTPPP